eukprot:m.165832 g.165832  ORF g.165832 m.165832 type:complete len:505 (-) comp16606_c0_seq8:170-1684(-)
MRLSTLRLVLLFELSFMWKSSQGEAPEIERETTLTLRKAMHLTTTTCFGGGTLIQMEFQHYCACNLKKPFCRGPLCSFSWASVLGTSDAQFGEPVKHWETYQYISNASDDGAVLVDGYSPSCEGCECYRELDSNQPSLSQTMRRYQVLHHQIRQGVRPYRAIVTTRHGFGWGDRVRGFITLLYAAIGYDAALFFGVTKPSELIRSFNPIMVDWRPPSWQPVQRKRLDLSINTSRSVCSQLADFRIRTEMFHTTMMDTAVDIAVDCNLWLIPCMWQQVAVDQPPNSLRSTLRTVDPVEESLAVKLGFVHLPFPASYAFDVLFRPQPHLVRLKQEIQQAASLSPSDQYIGIHIRTGKLPSGRHDRERTQPDSFVKAFECVARQEALLRLPASTKWYFATDYPPAHETLRQWLQQHNLSASKAMDISMVNGVITHVGLDKPDLVGETFAYLDFLMLKKALFVAGTESGFNVMAALAGQHRRLLFLPDCVVRSSEELGELRANNYTRL